MKHHHDASVHRRQLLKTTAGAQLLPSLSPIPPSLPLSSPLPLFISTFSSLGLWSAKDYLVHFRLGRVLSGESSFSALALAHEPRLLDGENCKTDANFYGCLAPT